MTPIPPCPSFHPREGFSVVSLDCGIYVIGGSRKRKNSRSPRVLLLDCRTHTWRQVPSMTVARRDAVAGVVNGKIYVLGGCKRYENYGEVFDPETQTWTTLPPVPGTVMSGSVIWEVSFRKFMVMGEKFYAVPICIWYRASLLSYSPNEGIWERGMKDIDVSMLGTKSYCFSKAENVLYSCDDLGNVYWRETEDPSEWKQVKRGLGALHSYFDKPMASIIWDTAPCDELFKGYSKVLRNVGTNILIFWFKYNPNKSNVDIWCAEISLERCHDISEISGKIEWLQPVAEVEGHPASHVNVLHSAYVNV
ncbi:unnamed protein product [Eruca vesicaria subsp. sativa]|uniref:FKB95-like N-terminal Kelch domain-containing protein n=1 Tax=Eruca vesicaria subsp. sativa TaxID=29727 RepID=A0ABC8K3E7_ERUVS|nr:unnamed protein product [Eruca vesicaria subsp. sativa]